MLFSLDSIVIDHRILFKNLNLYYYYNSIMIMNKKTHKLSGDSIFGTVKKLYSVHIFRCKFRYTFKRFIYRNHIIENYESNIIKFFPILRKLTEKTEKYYVIYVCQISNYKDSLHDNFGSDLHPGS